MAAHWYPAANDSQAAIADSSISEGAYSAMAQAAHDTLAAVYPRQKFVLDEDLAKFWMGFKIHDAGAHWGASVAAAVIADRENDGHDAAPPTSNALTAGENYHHISDPTVTPKQPLYAKHFGDVRLFGTSGHTPLPNPLDLDYVAAYNEVKELGARESTIRTQEETYTGIFWAYDGSFKNGTPIRLYNQVLNKVVTQVRKRTNRGFHRGALPGQTLARGSSLVKLYAMVNVAMADTAILSWKEKYEKDFWRPVAGIRAGANDTYPETEGDPQWTPLGTPMTNTPQASTTPAFPAYPSAHASIGTAAMTVMRDFLQLTPDFTFSMASDELNGKSTYITGEQRPVMHKTFSLDEAMQANDMSRVYLGVHWHFDCTQGSALGREIAGMVLASFPKRG
jgi:hypothetical protein